MEPGREGGRGSHCRESHCNLACYGLSIQAGRHVAVFSPPEFELDSNLMLGSSRVYVLYYFGVPGLRWDPLTQQQATFLALALMGFSLLSMTWRCGTAD